MQAAEQPGCPFLFLPLLLHLHHLFAAAASSPVAMRQLRPLPSVRPQTAQHTVSGRQSAAAGFSLRGGIKNKAGATCGMSGHNFRGRRDSDTRDLFGLFLLFASLQSRRLRSAFSDLFQRSRTDLCASCHPRARQSKHLDRTSTRCDREK
ncbi:hypothetical protein CHARACLAT_022322 [Characodon lateralis]|uniref:Secreted protein n=1 Tax=Characodon lateralis TaxID=208331 RepID=A0ABU7DIY5_9TELE|nr:hypothetical protein [Characodon lateralis]